MISEREVVVALAEGLHARPAARVAQLAGSFRAEISIGHGGQQASAKSTVRLMLLAVGEGEVVRIRAEGEDAPEAVAELARLISGEGDRLAVAPPPDAPSTRPPPPAAASPAGADEVADEGDGRVRGIAASEGVALGPVFACAVRALDPPVRAVPPDARAAEIGRFREAAARVAMLLDTAAADRKDEAGGQTEAQVFTAVREIATDASLIEGVGERVAAGQDAASATLAVGRTLADRLARVDDPYFRLRSEDVRGVARQIAAVLLGLAADEGATLDRPSVVVADALTAVDLARLPTRFLLGLLTAEGGAASHVAIIARALGVPAVVGVPAASLRLVRDARTVALDGAAGVAIPDPPPDVVKEFERRAREEEAAREALRRFVGVAPRLADGTPIEVAANIGSPGEVDAAIANGAMGVGLFRTEFLFMDADVPPDEDEQTRVYARVLSAFAPHPVIVRTLDIGGDKPLPGLAIEPEANPFLGWRGIRMCLGRPDLFRPQLRALLRAAPHGRLRVMFPMISDVAEVREARALIEDCRRSLLADGIACGPAPIEIGIMIETPAAALCAAVLAREVDFFSIGTNDLTQYTMAADRTNPRLAALGSASHPAVLRLIEMACAAAREAGIWVGVCGEAAADPALIPRLLAWGVTELSMGASFIPRAKQTIVTLGKGAVPDGTRPLSA